MKQLLSIIFSIWLLLPTTLCAQTCADFSVQVDVVVQESSALITLNWINDLNATQYQVYRKGLQTTGWGASIAILAGTANQFIDSNVQTDTAYEYKIY